MDAFAVVQVIETDWLLEYVPATGENVGVDAAPVGVLFVVVGVSGVTTGAVGDGMVQETTVSNAKRVPTNRLFVVMLVPACFFRGFQLPSFSSPSTRKRGVFI